MKWSHYVATFIVLFVFNILCVHSFDITLEPLRPTGIKFTIEDSPGITLVAFHYNINQPLSGVAAGAYNVDVLTKTGGKWVHENRMVSLSVGDKIYYWILKVQNGRGTTVQNQVWTFTAPRPSTTTTTTKRQSTPSSSSSSPSPASSGSTTSNGGLETATPAPHASSTTSGGPGPVNPPTPRPDKAKCQSYPCLIFEDNFDKLNFKNWQHEITAGGGGNWEFQYYTNNRSNSYVRDGKLYIRPTLTAETIGGHDKLFNTVFDIWGSNPADQCTANQFWGCFRTGTGSNPINVIQSARLRSVGKFDFRYGKVEVRAKMPTGDWIWPAIWMLPTNNEYGQWPASGEIDIVEARGNRDLFDPQTGESVGIDQMGSTLHWGPAWNQNAYEKTHARRNAKSGDFGSDFHTYTVEWGEDGFSFFLDHELLVRIDAPDEGFWKFGEFDEKMDNPWKGAGKMAPFDKEFYIIMNVAVGGTAYFKDRFQNRGPGGAKPWRDTSQTAMLEFVNAKDRWYPTWKTDEDNGEGASMVVDYVKVWKLKNN